MGVFGSQEPHSCFFLKELCASPLRIMEMLASNFCPYLFPKKEIQTVSLRKARKVSAWLHQLERPDAEIRERIAHIFGSDPALIQSRVAQYRTALEAFGKAYGMDRDVVVVRAPARINLMGVHIEHRGGWVNYMAISREIVLVAERRDDDEVVLRNVDDISYPPRAFRIKEKLPPDQRGD
ncbi:MAG: hypothetical protein DRP97_06305, partial [Candidatus Latescibacterota bacterium]